MAEILVVEDDACISLLIKHILKMDGHSVQAAFSGEEALALLGPEGRQAGRRRPSLILTDVLLASMDGYALTKHLAKAVRLRNIPVIVLTARRDLREVFLSLSNVVDFIEKPFAPGELQKAVNYHIGSGTTVSPGLR